MGKFGVDYRPQLRWPLDISHIKEQAQNFIVLRDPDGLAAQPAIIPELFLPIISRFDGNHSIAEIAAQGAHLGVTPELVSQLASELASLLMLNTPEVSAKWNLTLDDFRSSLVRIASFAGTVYPLDPTELRSTIKRYIAETTQGVPLRFEQPSSFVGFIAPHIDYRRGWRTYAAGYRELAAIPRPDIIFLLGTAHQPGQGYFHLTSKDFETPLGIIPTAHEIVDSLATKYGYQRAFQNEILHRREHSLELQLPFLAYRFEEEGVPAIIPILVGSFDPPVRLGVSPTDIPEVGDFIESLAEITKSLRDSGRNVLFYAGVDLAHVGLYFGDKFRFCDSQLDIVEARDRELLDAIFLGDEQKLFKHIEQDLDARRICGFPSIYTMLSAMKRAGMKPKGQLIDYSQAVDSQTDCVVTFASAAWFSVT